MGDDSSKKLTSLLAIIPILISMGVISIGDDQVTATLEAETEPTTSENNDWLTVTYLSFEYPGDSTLIEFPNESVIIIDGGERFKSPVKTIKSILEERGIEKIDLMILTHGDSDHVGGLKNLLEDQYWKDNVSEVWTSAYGHHTTKTYKSFFENIRSSSIPQHNVTNAITSDQNDLLNSFESEFMEIEIIGPPEIPIPSSSKHADTKNSNSIITKLSYGDVSFLFPGDSTWTTERWLKESSYDIDVDILSASHHGSKYASGWDADGAYEPTFIESVSPRVVIYSVDPSEDQSEHSNERSIDEHNKHGHPHTETITRWSDYDSDIKQLRTSWEGHITIKTNGIDCFIKTETEPTEQSCW